MSRRTTVITGILVATAMIAPAVLSLAAPRGKTKLMRQKLVCTQNVLRDCRWKTMR